MDTSQTRSKERRQRLLDAALSVFSKKGYRDGAMDEIAGESGTSKGGVYFHFPSKQAIFLALLDRTAARLLDNVEEAIASENDPIAKADAALLAVLRTFARHRGLARLFMVEALGAGREFHERVLQIHSDFARVIKRQLDEAVAEGVIEPVDTDVASRAWFGALNEIVTTWVLSKKPGSLEESYRALRPILMRSVGVSDFSTKAQETR
ncbi:MAG: TetR/AcrR family transcriptional regulator [Chloroflexi bacterium]|nr:TetR/AcrR family transcriptional regulator [Chloroflexota bacterium]MCH8849721.1 TetR/AcrR family transcriptional regulator [Chloroflexota bacterium]